MIKIAKNYIMKNIILTILIIGVSISCKAQNYPLFNPSDNFDTNGAYYKDSDNDLQKLVGIWKYESDNEIFEIELSFKVDYFSDSEIPNYSQYEDMLYGEYKYINSNDEEIVNSLSDINNFTDNISQHLIFGNEIYEGIYSNLCDDCAPNERIVDLFIEDPQREYIKYTLQIRHLPENQFLNEPERIMIFIKQLDMTIIPQGEPSDHRLPLRTVITLIKQ
ncbi:hypothetical protein ACSSV5_002449 [Psychroflexus sp. MBR-150]|jgi:hypothetical protein